jgi:hypothetical protein
MNERDEKILKHIGKYGLSIRAVIEALFCDGATSDHILNRLIREKRIASEAGIPGGICYYHLTLTEARARSIPEHRARKKKGAALRQAIQVLWFCCMGGKRRNRIERNQLGRNFGNGKGSGKAHCAEVDEERSTVYRLYVPGPNSRDDYLLKTLRVDYEVAKGIPSLMEWIRDDAFAFAVLVETPERKTKLERMVIKHGLKNIRILVEVVPGLSNLAVAIREKQGGTSSAA